MRNTISKLAGAAAMVGLLGIAPQQSSAAPVLNGCGGGDFGAACSLAELIGGGSMIINDTMFSNFALTAIFGSRAVNTSVVRVDAIETLYNPGFRLVDTGNTLRAGGAVASTQNDFSFDVTMVGGNLRIKDNSLVVAVGDLTGVDSFTQVIEAVNAPDGSSLGFKEAFCDTTVTPGCANTNVSDLASFDAVNALSIAGSLDVVADAAGIAAINSITLQFSQVPEPASFALLALGFAGIGFSRRSKRVIGRAAATTGRLRRWGSALVLAALSVVPVTTASAATGLELVSLSNTRPDKISGGDVLVLVRAPASLSLADISVRLNNNVDVTHMFRTHPTEHALIGLVTGLPLGKTALLARGRGVPTATLQLTNYPITGPVFSGPHEQPFFCESANFNIGNGVLLGPPIDANCSVNTRVDYRYRTTAGAFAILTNQSVLPSNVATTTTLEGKTVNYIVRVETGTVNRGIYQIAILHDPTKEPAPDFTVQSEGWNKRLFYTYGGGCGGGWYAQGTATGGVMVDELLRQGYAVTSSTLNVFSNNCNETTTTETQMMVKERFIEHYGVPRFTMGSHVSAATYQMHHATNNYPGILDGIIDAGSFPDSTGQEQPDAVVLKWYWDIKAPGTFTMEQQRHVFGYRVHAAIQNRFESGQRNDPTALFRAAVPVSARYNPVTNRDGARGTQQDHSINIYGADPITGFGRRAYDNVGLQYGLASLNQGVITKTQFLDMNEKIGGFDIDFNPTAARLQGDPIAIRNLYQSGRVLDASSGIASTPIIDYRAYTDALASGDQHVRFHGFSTRDRLIKANGNADNQVMFIEDNRFGLFSFGSPRVLEAIRRMDEWLVNLKNDTSNDPQRTKVIRAKPAGLKDTCWSPDPTPLRIEEPQSYGNGNTQCNIYYPSFFSPRLVAGAPLANNVIKCQLKPVNMADYTASFTTEEQNRLRAIFPDGVCDFTKPGVEQQKVKGQWQSF